MVKPAASPRAPTLLAGWIAALFLLLAPAVRAADDSRLQIARVLPSGELPKDSRLGPLKDLNGSFPFEPPESVDAWQRRAAEVRRRILVAAGLWPMPETTPLNAVVHGQVERDGYTIEKVFFESYPGHFVTGSLYRPTGRTGKLPAVLCPHGHFPDGRLGEAAPEQVRRQIELGAERSEVNGRYPLQAAAAQLARIGCVALVYDMVGYADSQQIPYPVGHFYSLKRQQMETPSDWGFFSTQANLRLQSILGLQTYNSLRALDFVCSLPEVDQNRIAITGASSGGTQTMLLCAIDPRPAVSAPIVMVSTAMQGGCTCENANLLRIGTGNVEFAALFAPKPLAAIGANDWTKEMETKGGPELEQLYRALGAPENVEVQSFLQFPHNFNVVSREAMYAWLNRHLNLGLPEPIIEREIAPLSREELSVWDAQHPQPAGGEDYERRLLRQMTDDSRRQLERLMPRDAQSLAEFRRVVGGAWQVMIGRELPRHDDVEFEHADEPTRLGDYVLTKGLLRYKPNDEEVPAIVLSPSKAEVAGNHVVIWLDPAGKAALVGDGGLPRPGVRKLLDAGAAVVGLDLLYQGEFLAEGKLPEQARRVPIRNNRDSAAYTFGYNPSLFAHRVHDVLTAVAYFDGPDVSARRVNLVGLSGAGHWAAAAKALAGEHIDRTAISTDGFRFANLRSVYDSDFLPGAAKYLDLPGAIALCAPGPLWLADDARPDGGAQIIRAAYEASAAPSAVNYYKGPDDDFEAAAIDWLLQPLLP